MNNCLHQSWGAKFRHLLYLVGAVGLTWPLGKNIGSYLPIGTEGSATVPLFNLWTLLWNSKQLQHGFAGYWDAPVFFPETGTFALSDPQPLTGLIYSIFVWLSKNPVAAYNLVLLLFLTLNGISAEWLLRKLNIRVGPAFLGGLLALGLPFVGNELGVLQLTALFPFFFAIGALITFAQTPGWRVAFSIGIWNAAAFLLSAYYGLFLSVFMLLGGIVLVVKPLFRIKVIFQLGVGALLAGLLLLPVLPEQTRLTAAYSRGDSTIKDNSAEPNEYLHLDRRTLGQRWLPWLAEDDGSQRLYPGTILLALALIGFFSGLQNRSERRWVTFVFLGAVIAFILSFGLNLSIADWQPYRLLKDYYPGFAQLRSPFRLAVVVQVFLVILAALGLNSIWRKRQIGRLIAALLVFLALLEVVAPPARLYPVPDQTFKAVWVDWLKKQPGKEAVLMLPMSQDSNAAAFEPIVIGMLQSFEHGRPLGNGYSGFFPSSYRSLKGRMVHFPDQDTIGYLQSIGFGYLVIDQTWWDKDKAQHLLVWEQTVKLVYEDEMKLIYQLVNSQ